MSEKHGQDHGILTDNKSGTVWNVGGQYMSGPLRSNLEAYAISDEYWFSWKQFHPNSQLIRLP